MAKMVLTLTIEGNAADLRNIKRKVTKAAHKALTGYTEEWKLTPRQDSNPDWFKALTAENETHPLML